MASRIINLNNTSPAASAGYQDALWQLGPTSGTDPTTGEPIYPVSAEVPNTGGVNAKTSSYTATAADCGKIISFNSSSAVTLTLPSAIPFAQWAIRVQNVGAGLLTVTPGGSLDIDGSTSSLTLGQNTGVEIQTDGSNYFTFRGSGGGISLVGIIIDGTGSLPLVGIGGFIQVAFAGTIVGWSLLADVPGSAATVEIWKVASSAPPSAPVIPTSANKISASAPCALSSAQSAAAGAAGVSTWTTAVAQWDVIAFNLTAVTTLTRLTVELQIQRS